MFKWRWWGVFFAGKILRGRGVLKSMKNHVVRDNCDQFRLVINLVFNALTFRNASSNFCGREGFFGYILSCLC